MVLLGDIPGVLDAKYVWLNDEPIIDLETQLKFGDNIRFGDEPQDGQEEFAAEDRRDLSAE